MRLPERSLLPAVGKSHAAQLVGVEPVQQLEQARTPARLGGDAFQQVAQDGQDAEHVVRAHLINYGPSYLAIMVSTTYQLWYFLLINRGIF